MKVFYAAFLIGIFALPLAANCTEIVQRNVSFDDCSISPEILKTNFSEYFSHHKNIFEGIVQSVGAVPYRPKSAVNECWAKIKITKWWKTNLDKNEVNIIFYTEPTGEMGLTDNERIHCPIAQNESVLVFTGDYLDEAIDSFYLNSCSHYLSLKSASFMQKLLGLWSNRSAKQ